MAEGGLGNQHQEIGGKMGSGKRASGEKNKNPSFPRETLRGRRQETHVLEKGNRTELGEKWDSFLRVMVPSVVARRRGKRVAVKKKVKVRRPGPGGEF